MEATAANHQERFGYVTCVDPGVAPQHEDADGDGVLEINEVPAEAWSGVVADALDPARTQNIVRPPSSAAVTHAGQAIIWGATELTPRTFSYHRGQEVLGRINFSATGSARSSRVGLMSRLSSVGRPQPTGLMGAYGASLRAARNEYAQDLFKKSMARLAPFGVIGLGLGVGYDALRSVYRGDSAAVVAETAVTSAVYAGGTVVAATGAGTAVGVPVGMVTGPAGGLIAGGATMLGTAAAIDIFGHEPVARFLYDNTPGVDCGDTE